MNVKKIKGIDVGKNNVILTHFPYYWAPIMGFSSGEQFLKNNIIFLGNDMKGFMAALGNDPEILRRYIEMVNQCLDYIRRECVGCEFFYKSHPADPDEQKYLNLRGFKVIKEHVNAEIFFWKNRERIKSVFAVNSLGLLSAYGFGLNAYAFSEFFRPIFGEKLFESIDDCYAGLPDRFFIRDFGQTLTAYGVPVKVDPMLESFLTDLLLKNKGDVWLVVSATEFIVILISLTNFIKSFDPKRKIKLVISRHHRWDFINLDDIKPYFDEIIFMPRVFYSLKIRKIIEVVKVWQKVKQFKLKPNDIIISGSQVEFVENCFISDYNGNQRIGLIMKRDFYANYNTTNSIFSKNKYFRFSKASWFFNKILEPILGLNKTLFLLYSPGCTAITRYQEPVNKIFDQVIMFDIPR
ncbi:MAG TPA: hypothetical protein VJC06_04000 [Candidatus Paceibacterota bacterium]